MLYVYFMSKVSNAETTTLVLVFNRKCWVRFPLQNWLHQAGVPPVHLQIQAQGAQKKMPWQWHLLGTILPFLSNRVRAWEVKAVDKIIVADQIRKKETFVANQHFILKHQNVKLKNSKTCHRFVMCVEFAMSFF